MSASGGHEEQGVAARGEADPARARGGNGGARVVAVYVVIGALVAGVVLTQRWLLRRAESRVNHAALADSPRGVTTVLARRARFRPTRRYIGTLDPWLEARVGPQLVSAYVSEVRVRPGADVRRGDVLATLDCRSANASTHVVALQARALEARQAALARQAARMESLVPGGFAAANDLDQRRAESESEAARLAATRAQLQGSSLLVDDCVLRAPFDGEVATRAVDPGGFARPGVALVTLVDRSTVRVVADVPETDFTAVPPGAAVRLRLLSTGQRLEATVTRRSPAADPSTRTLRIEIDVPDRGRTLPVGTTAEILVEVGEPQDAVTIPATAAALRGNRATVFVVERGVARRRRLTLVGERGGTIFVDPSLSAGAHVVTEGRGLLEDGSAVTERVEEVAATEAPEAPGGSGAANTPSAQGAANTPSGSSGSSSARGSSAPSEPSAQGAPRARVP